MRAAGKATYGLRGKHGSRDIYLIQISGGGRLRVCDMVSKKEYWMKRTSLIPWQVYETKLGEIYNSIEDAETIKRNLSK